MTLKSLIQWLLDSRTTPEEAGHSAMPDYSAMTTFASNLSGTGNIYEGVAPSDGYLYIRARHAENNSNLNVNTEGKWVTCPSPFNGSLSGMMKPVKKGQSFTLAGNRISEVLVGFIASIGGRGYNNLVRRALSCLKPLSNYLPRSFCKAKSSGSAAKPSLNRELSLVVRQESMLHQRMDTSVSSILAVPEAICFLTLMQELLRVRRLQIVVSEIVGCFMATLSCAPLSLLKKGCQSILRPIQSRSRFGSVRQRVGVNLSAGGALC